MLNYLPVQGQGGAYPHELKMGDSPILTESFASTLTNDKQWYRSRGQDNKENMIHKLNKWD